MDVSGDLQIFGGGEKTPKNRQFSGNFSRGAACAAKNDHFSTDIWRGQTPILMELYLHRAIHPPSYTSIELFLHGTILSFGIYFHGAILPWSYYFMEHYFHAAILSWSCYFLELYFYEAIFSLSYTFMYKKRGGGHSPPSPRSPPLVEGRIVPRNAPKNLAPKAPF